jgi:predicted phosphoribosyltransferase
MVFASREQAGQALALHLQHERVAVDFVLGLPRGGVVVAAEVAHVLNCPLDVIVVRKIGHPWYREFAVGALAEPDVAVLDEAAIRANPVLRSELDAVIREEAERLRAYQERFHQSMPDLANKTVLLVDDGLATGATMEAAARSAKKQQARRTIVAVPVASVSAVTRLERAADQVVALMADPAFDAVGRYYDLFPQTSDEEVLSLLRAEHTPR